MHVIVLVLWALTLCRTVYSEIISKLYGLNGFVKVKSDITRYFLKIRTQTELLDNLYDIVKWCRTYFGKQKQNKGSNNL